jgi:secondary thiamine-phosphate synthase enzyme
MVKQQNILIQTSGRGMINVTPEVSEILSNLKIEAGLCNIFLHHTSASLILCENADPQVQHDMERFFQRLIPDGDALFKHIDEGVDDMPAHIRTILTQNSICIPVHKNKLDLGAWQGIFLWEHRLQPHSRKITVTLI